MAQRLLDFDPRTGRTELSVKVDTSEIDYLNALEKSIIGDGWTAGRTMRAVAEIPYDFLDSLARTGDFDAIMLMEENTSPKDRRRALRGILQKFPEFSISNGHI